ncbi:MAG: AAA family ATPase, partial [Betaproteobacteria bacterium]|nr:AAA family ATPase [Betaproteobacteria bacterium]
MVGEIEQCLKINQNLIVMLLGARRTGKTTALNQLVERMETRNWPVVFRSFDSSSPSGQKGGSISGQDNSANDLYASWQEARQHAQTQAQPVLLVFDEIQGVAGWHRLVKGLWDEDQSTDANIKVVLTGSAPLYLERGAADKLLGRYVVVDCPHWSLAEMAEVFGHDLDRYLFFGGYPLSVPEKEWRRFVHQIIDVFVIRDLLSVVPDIRNKEGLLRMLPALFHYAGRVVSYNTLTKLVPEVSNTTTLARYLDYFKHMRLVTGLPNYSPLPHGRRPSPKIVVHNNALITAGLTGTFADFRADATLRGRLIKNAGG